MPADAFLNLERLGNWSFAPLGTLANKPHGIAIKQFVAACMVEQHGHPHSGVQRGQRVSSACRGVIQSGAYLAAGALLGEGFHLYQLR
jgi:hypothetical protein